MLLATLVKECDGKVCGDNCIVEGDMAGLCDSHGKCSFDYDNIKCGKYYFLQIYLQIPIGVSSLTQFIKGLWSHRIIKNISEQVSEKINNQVMSKGVIAYPYPYNQGSATKDGKN